MSDGLSEVLCLLLIILWLANLARLFVKWWVRGE